MVYRSKPHREWRPRMIWWLLPVIIALVFFVAPSIGRTLTDWLWYRELGRLDVYWTMFWGSWVLGIAVGAVFFLAVFANVYFALRGTPDATWADLSQRLRDR